MIRRLITEITRQKMPARCYCY